MVVTFTAPGITGGSAIAGYEYSADGGAWTALTTAGTGPYEGTTRALSPAATHRIRVRAVNGAGPGTASLSADILIPTAPGAPTGVAATPGDGSATITFDAPADDGGSPIIGYSVTARPGGATWSCPSSPCPLPGLSNGVAYTFKVAAVNAVGTSPLSAAGGPVRPAGRPGAPTGLSGTATTTGLTLTFTAPDTGGSAILAYQVSIDGGATWATLNAGRTVGGLLPGTAYDISVRAVNAIGTGPATATVTLRTRPPAPAAPTATAGVSSVTVSWDPATSTGVTGYTVYASPGPATCSTGWSTATSCVIGATAGVAYTYTLVVHATGGDSPTSSASDPVTPTAPPVPATPPATTTPTLSTPTGQPAVVSPSQRLTVVGSGFAAYSTTTLTLYSTPVVLGTVEADARGNLKKRITIPSGLKPGRHTIVASGVDAHGRTRAISMTFTVKAKSPGDTLPVTGVEAAQLALLGLALIAAGLLVVRRRSRAA